MDKLNTHYYDGKLVDTVPVDVKNIPDVQKLERIRALQAMLPQLVKLTPQAIHNLNTIVEDYASAGGANNHDSTNGLKAEELLCMIHGLMTVNAADEKRKDVAVLLADQLHEMSSGMCPQGRTHRLYQVILCFD